MFLNRRVLLGSAVALGLTSMLTIQAAAQGNQPNVTVWVQSGPEAEALAVVADAYTKSTGNPVAISPQGRAGWRQRYETALAAGSTEFDGVPAHQSLRSGARRGWADRFIRRLYRRLGQL